MKNTNHITIHGWMVNELNLKGNDLLVYAIIYGFSQIENQRFTGGLQYLADWCNATKQGVIKNLKNLIDKGLIEKFEYEKNGIKFCEYSCTVLNYVEWGIKQSLTNNIAINNKLFSKENNTEFESKQKKDNLYSKCVSLIDDFTQSLIIRTKLIEYLNLAIEMRNAGKFNFYTNSWKGMLRKLKELADNDKTMEEIIEQSIQKSYRGFFPLAQRKYNNSIKDRVSEVDVSSETYSREELKQLAEQDKERERKGLKTVF